METITQGLGPKLRVEWSTATSELALPCTLLYKWRHGLLEKEQLPCDVASGHGHKATGDSGFSFFGVTMMQRSAAASVVRRLGRQHCKSEVIRWVVLGQSCAKVPSSLRVQVYDSIALAPEQDLMNDIDSPRKL